LSAAATHCDGAGTQLSTVMLLFVTQVGLGKSPSGNKSAPIMNLDADIIDRNAGIIRQQRALQKFWSKANGVSTSPAKT